MLVNTNDAIAAIEHLDVSNLAVGEHVTRVLVHSGAITATDRLSDSVLYDKHHFMNPAIRIEVMQLDKTINGLKRLRHAY